VSKADLPLRLLIKNINSEIFVKLKNGSEYIGMLERCDPCMNIVLADTKEVKEDSRPITVLGKVLIRGSNILYISVDTTRIEFKSMESESKEESTNK